MLRKNRGDGHAVVASTKDTKVVVVFDAPSTTKPSAVITQASSLDVDAIRAKLKRQQTTTTAKLQPSQRARGIFGRLDPFRQLRYRRARRRWNVGTVEEQQPDLFDSPLQEAAHLLRELAISLEAAKDKKRLTVVERVLELVHQPNLDTASVNEAAWLSADAQMREYLGGNRRSDRRSSNSTPLSSPVATPSNKHAPTFAMSTLMPEIAPAGASAVAKMLDEGLNTWTSEGFDSNELDRLTGGNPLVALGMALHKRHGWEASLGVAAPTMLTFLSRLQSAYLPVAYHNAKHATDVTHGTHWLLTQLTQLNGVAASAETLFSTVLAALIHDVGHDGRGNAYHNATWDEPGAELALLYSDQAALERHHCACGFRLMRDTGLLESLTLEARKAVRERVVGMVLATDFGEHVKVVNKFKLMLAASVPQEGGHTTADKERAASLTTGEDDGAPARVARTHKAAERDGVPVFSAAEHSITADERMTISSMVIKIADLSYPSKGLDYSLVWIDRCLDEFVEQGDRERERGLHVGYDRSTIDQWKAKSQIGFFTFMVRPMFEALDQLAPLTEPLDKIDELIAYWKERQKEKEALAAAKAGEAVAESI